MHAGRINSQDLHLDFADKRQAFVSPLTKHSRSQKTKNCFCEAYCYYKAASCTAVLARVPTERVSLEYCLPDSVQSSNTAATGTKTLLPGCYEERFMLVMSTKKRGLITQTSGSALRDRTSTARLSRGIKHFPKSFYHSGTILNPGFYQIFTCYRFPVLHAHSTSR